MVILTIVGLLALWLLWAALYDRRVRRRRADLVGRGDVDARAARDARRNAQTDVRVYSNQQDFGNPGGTFGGGL